MKVIALKLKASAITVKKELYDLLKQDAPFIGQIPAKYKGFQSKPNPYFIYEDDMLKTVANDIKERETMQSKPNTELVDACNKIINLIQKEGCILIYISLSA